MADAEILDDEGAARDWLARAFAPSAEQWARLERFAAMLVAEIGITLRDFVVEDTVRRPLGGVFAGERVTHAVMGILYGAALAFPAVLVYMTVPRLLDRYDPEPVSVLLGCVIWGAIVACGVANDKRAAVAAIEAGTLEQWSAAFARDRSAGQ